MKALIFNFVAETVHSETQLGDFLFQIVNWLAGACAPANLKPVKAKNDPDRNECADQKILLIGRQVGGANAAYNHDRCHGRTRDRVANNDACKDWNCEKR